ncbi:MAG: hypothetical protein O3A00_05290 [Planctomycetota bacterium]|nr:hypothetical protein [Planctomycetota bacterium]
MVRGIQWFMERMAERVVPIITGAFTSTIETMDALGRAEQQSQLEEAARRYEADGQATLAETLRRRASQLDATNPGSSGVVTFENVARDESRMQPPSAETPTPRLEARKRSAASQQRRRLSESDED